jgi:hypothetical protein
MFTQVHPSKAAAVAQADTGAPKWLRMQQKDSVHEMIVDDVVAIRLLRPLGHSHLALVTIFGQARKGKSFLMNKLTRQPSLFPVQSR